MSRVQQAAGEDWIEGAAAYLAAYARRTHGQPFLIEDAIEVYAGVRPPNPKAWGPATLAAMVGLMGRTGHASVHRKKVDYSRHPLTGMWLAMPNPALPENPPFPAPSLFTADGFTIFIFPITDLGPQGTIFQTGFTGTWEPDGPQRGHFTGVQLLSDANGRFTGSVTVDGYPVVSEDGQTFIDDGSKVLVTIRDPAGAVVASSRAPAPH